MRRTEEKIQRQRTEEEIKGGERRGYKERREREKRKGCSEGRKRRKTGTRSDDKDAGKKG